MEACWKVNEVKAHTQLKEEEIDRFSHGAKHLEAVPHIQQSTLFPVSAKPWTLSGGLGCSHDTQVYEFLHRN